MKRLAALALLLLGCAVFVREANAARMFPTIATSQLGWNYSESATVADTASAISGSWGDTAAASFDTTQAINIVDWVPGPYGGTSGAAVQPVCRISLLGTSSTLAVTDSIYAVIQGSIDGTTWTTMPVVHLGSTANACRPGIIGYPFSHANGYAASTNASLVDVYYTSLITQAVSAAAPATGTAAGYNKFSILGYPWIRFIIMGDCTTRTAGNALLGARFFVTFWRNPEQ